MGFDLFGITPSKQKTKFNHLIYQKKNSVLFCPKVFSGKSINPGIFFKLKELYDIKKINIFDRVIGTNKDIVITDHVNCSGLSFLIGKTPYKTKPMFPDMSTIYVKDNNEPKNTTYTTGPQNYLNTSKAKGIVFSESIAPVSIVWHYVGVKVRGYGVSDIKNSSLLKLV